MSGGYRHYRIEIMGSLVPKTPFHVGSGQDLHTASDSPLLRDGNHPAGDLYLPGSSLRGALRSHLEREAGLLGCGQTELASFFGCTKDEEGTYGRFQVFDARRAQAGAAELRDHARIDETWGAAASGAKFDFENGFSQGFEFGAAYEGDGPDDPEMRLFAEAVRFLQSGEFRLGAKAGWGMGRMQLAPELRILQFDRSTDAGLLDYLKWRLHGNAPASSALPPGGGPTATPRPSNPWNTITLTLALQFEGPMLVKSAVPAPKDSAQSRSDLGDPGSYCKRASANADSTFVTTIDPRGHTYYLPGSSLRGVLRHEAVWIAGKDQGRRQELELLFGTANDNGGGAAGRFEIEDGLLSGDAAIVALDHVAIDRLVQGAAEGKKFDAAALASPRFCVRLTLRFESNRVSLVRWLAALLDRMRAGRLWAGSGSARGYGLLKTVDVEKAVLDVTDGLQWTFESTPERRQGRSVYTWIGFDALDPVWKVVRPEGKRG